MEEEAIVEMRRYFKNAMSENPDLSESVAAIITLNHFIETTKFETVQGFNQSLDEAINVLKTMEVKKMASISSGCLIFKKYISRTDALEMMDIRDVMAEIVRRGKAFVKDTATSRDTIAEHAYKWIKEDMNILVHSRSRVVLEVLKRASEHGTQFHVYVTESQPDKSGHLMLADLKELGIKCTLIIDASIMYIMKRISFVALGAECVVANGGIINKIGSYTIGQCAHALKKPVYVMAESVKFNQLFPFSQNDVPPEFKYESNSNSPDDHPLVDYTPPQVITLLFTNIGIMPPQSVSIELSNMFV